MKTAFIGLGGMGYSMAANLQAAGLLNAVYNRTTEKADAFAKDSSPKTYENLVDHLLASISQEDSPSILTSEARNLLRHHSWRGNIRELQQALNDKGYPSGEPDGILGSNTRKAIRAYQKAEGLVADGFPSEQVLAALGVYSGS